MMCRASIAVLVVLTLATKVVPHKIIAEEYEMPPNVEVVRDFPPIDSEEEYIRHIHSMINGHRSDTRGGRLVIQTNSLIDTKYKTWKRNADLINSLLSLPKGLNEAGR